MSPDLVMPNRDRSEALKLKQIRHTDADLAVIDISDAHSNGANASKNGNTDFRSDLVVQEDRKNGIASMMQSRSAPAFVRHSRAPGPEMSSFDGVSPQMREIHSMAGRIAGSEAPVLIQGETGSGKEVLARELHARSPRNGKPFLKVNCAALPSELVESELFGFERGAFTGAFQKKFGMFELADGGTVLLDEIGDMDVKLQAKLLQVLQDKEFQRIGGKEVIRVDVRIIAATHRDLEKAIVDGEFREDLYYRLNVITLHLPRLCERKDDIVPLAEFLIRKHSSEGAPPQITLDLRNAFMAYHWPGNIRELENVVRRLLILRNPGLIIAELARKTTRESQQPTAQMTPAAQPASAPEGGSPILDQFTEARRQAESEAILAALDSTRWNRKQAASVLRIDYKALLYKMKKLGM